MNNPASNQSGPEVPHQHLPTAKDMHDDAPIGGGDGESVDTLGEFDFEDDDSDITVDENTPGLSDEESLNSQVPTNQLKKLRQ